MYPDSWGIKNADQMTSPGHAGMDQRTRGSISRKATGAREKGDGPDLVSRTKPRPEHAPPGWGWTFPPFLFGGRPGDAPLGGEWGPLPIVPSLRFLKKCGSIVAQFYCRLPALLFEVFYIRGQEFQLFGFEEPKP